ncbi:hypothetical protein [Hymenobacter rubripertinctus]|uniref:Lipoprotein n=1 Tax=Hymenobacter rubripertinctus TaxID=2029981 RepID=A0A418QJ09_9BACT|nr:hypothetical protein [Hymenobacter rubripertinctus]RIY05099.1 hypothetical protein D0T11_20980 [Hymenobacter rubripertinctus]
MKKTLLLLSAAAAFSLGSCSENKTTETATATDGMTTTTTTTTTTAYSPEAIERRADRIAADMAAKMQFDDATRTKIRTVYVTRGQRLAELQNQYAADTMGMAAARREVYSNADLEMKSVFTDPTQYSAYESSRMDYMDDRYMDDNTMSSSSDMNSSGDMTDGMEAGSKMKDADGNKVKVKADGDIKIKDSEGNKAKMDADDGTVKMKPADGGKTVIK